MVHAMPIGDDRRPRPVVDSKLAINGFEVDLDRAFRNAQLAADFLVRLTLLQGHQDLSLARCQASAREIRRLGLGRLADIANRP